jgi:hypothetical protein
MIVSSDRHKQGATGGDCEPALIITGVEEQKRRRVRDFGAQSRARELHWTVLSLGIPIFK